MIIDLEGLSNFDEAAAEANLRELGVANASEFRILNWDLIEKPFRVTVETWIAALGRLGPLRLERFIVDTYFQTLTRQASVHCGDITPILRASAELEMAYVIGRASLSVLANEKLTELTLMGEEIGPETVAAIVRGPCPRLGRLDLGFCYEQRAHAGSQAAFIGALASHGLPALHTLTLGYPEDGAAMLEAVASSPLMPQLKVLAISGDVFRDEEAGMSVLRKHRSALSALEALYLPLEDVMDMTDEQLAELIPGIRGMDDWNAFGPTRYGGA